MSLLIILLVCTVLATPAQAAPLQEEVQPAPAQDTLRLDWGTYIGKLPAGQGKLYHKERGLYVGTFDKVVPSGKGIHIQADGSVYTGNFVRGAYRGYGRLFRATGAVICGEFSSGRANGLDTLYYPDGKVFIGIMQNNGPTKQGKTYKSADAAKLTRPQKPALPLTAEDEAFLQSLGYGAYDTPATFGKGASFFQVYIHPNFRYSESMADKIATVEYEFTVGEDGKLRDINILSSTDEYFSKELLRVLKHCPKWTPAMKDGKPVPYTIRNQRITFGGYN